jgi:hypothetical protein
MNPCAPAPDSAGVEGWEDFDEVWWMGHLAGAGSGPEPELVVTSTTKRHTSCAVYVSTANDSAWEGGFIKVYAVVKNARTLLATFILANTGNDFAVQGPFTVTSVAADSFDITFTPANASLTPKSIQYVTAIGFGYEAVATTSSTSTGAAGPLLDPVIVTPATSPHAGTWGTLIQVNTTTGPVVINMPAPPAIVGNVAPYFEVVDVGEDLTVNAATVNVASGDLEDPATDRLSGISSVVLRASGAAAKWYWNGTNSYIF